MNPLSAHFDRIDPRRIYLQRFLLLCLFLCYPLSRMVPVEWGWENGVVENTQVVVLLAGLFFAARAWLRGPNDVRSALALCAIPIWMILAGREMSWGAVFLPPLGFSPDGPVYSSSILPYRPAVPFVAGLLVLASLAVGWRRGVHRHLKQIVAHRAFPWLCVVIVLGAALGSTIGEGHLPSFARDLIKRSEVLEEMAECVGYLAMVTAQSVLLRYQAPALAGARKVEA